MHLEDWEKKQCRSQVSNGTEGLAEVTDPDLTGISASSDGGNPPPTHPRSSGKELEKADSKT